MLSAIFAILIYSLILTIVTLYKDSSGYYMVDDIDIVAAGPVCWGLVLIITLLKPFFKDRRGKEHKYKPQSTKYIQKTVKRIVAIYKKHLRGGVADLIDFSIHSGGAYNFNEIEGWDVLTVRRARYESINRRFSNLMWHQKEETVEELKKYFSKVKDYDDYPSGIYMIVSDKSISESRGRGIE